MIRTRLKMVPVLEYMLVGLIILECHSVYNCALNKNYYIREGTIIALLCLLLVKVWKVKISKRVFNRWLVWSLLLWVTMSFYIAINVEKSLALGFICKFMIGLPAFSLIVCIYIGEEKPYRLLSIFCRLMVVEAFVSLLFWVFASRLHLLRPTSYIYAVWGGEYNYPCYYGVYFERQSETFFSFSGLRNQGLFTEAPMHSLCLVFALAIHLFLCPKTDRKWLFGTVILTLGIITTITTTGYIMLLVIYSIWFLITQGKNRRLHYIKVVFAVLLAVLAFAVAIYIFLYISSGTYKWASRSRSLIGGLQAWLKSPLFGNGYHDVDTMRNINREYRNAGTTTSVMTILMQGGIALFSFYAVPLICDLSITIMKRDWYTTAFFIVFLIEFTVTTFSYNFYMLLLIGTFTGAWLCSTPQRIQLRKYADSRQEIAEQAK